MDGHRLEAVAARPGLPEELRLIIAAGGEPDLLAQLARPNPNLMPTPGKNATR